SDALYGFPHRNPVAVFLPHVWALKQRSLQPFGWIENPAHGEFVDFHTSPREWLARSISLRKGSATTCITEKSIHTQRGEKHEDTTSRNHILGRSACSSHSASSGCTLFSQGSRGHSRR